MIMEHLPCFKSHLGCCGQSNEAQTKPHSHEAYIVMERDHMNMMKVKKKEKKELKNNLWKDLIGPDFTADNRIHSNDFKQKGILYRKFSDYKIVKKGWRSRLSSLTSQEQSPACAQSVKRSCCIRKVKRPCWLRDIPAQVQSKQLLLLSQSPWREGAFCCYIR